MFIRVILATGVAATSAEAVATCTAIGAHPAPVLQYICQSEREWAESVASSDASVVKRILADDFIGVDPKGEQYRKAEMVADTAKASNTFGSNHLNDVIVRFYGNVAVAQGSESWQRKTGEKG